MAESAFFVTVAQNRHDNFAITKNFIMAKNTAEAEVLITMNGKAAENALEALRKQQEQCNDAIKAGIEAQKELDKLRKTAIGDYKKVEGRGYKEQEEYLKSIIKKGKEGTTTLNRLKKEINVTELATKKYAEVLKNINGSSLAELQAVAKQLKFEIRQLPPDTQKFIDKTKQLKDVNTRINQITTNFKGLVAEEKKATFTLRGLVDGFNKDWWLITMVAGAVTGISMTFRKAAQAAAELDDTYSDVMKTTGLLHDEVAELDKELMKIDTRTSREQLLLLARDAGKLGIQGKEDILGFVRAADQIQVALGEDLGEGAIRNLGKIADVLGLTQSMGIEKSLLSIASAVNAVGQASTASEGYLVEFTQRLAGVAAQTGISASNIIGFASGLDQSAMKVEMASTAFQKFLMKLYEDPAKFAAYANLEVGKFTELLQNDANQAVITILKALKDQDGFASLVPIFKDMGLDGARAVSVLAAMATNIQAVTDAQALANVEFEKATSVTEEYNTKNNNMQAQLEKARKEFQNASIALGQSLNPIMLKSTKLTTHLIKLLATYGKEMGAAAIAIAAVTLAIKRQAVAQTRLNVVQKAGNLLRATGNTIIWAARTAFFRLIGATEAATIAQAQLNAVMSASVIGVIALAVGGLTVAITRWVKKAREANEENKRMEEIQKRINSEYNEGASKVQALTNIVHNNNLELDQRRRALNELKSIVPGYHADLTEEGRLIDDNTESLKEYLKNLEKVTRQKILQEEYEKAVADVMAAEQVVSDAQKAKDKALKDANGNTATMTGITMQSSAGAYSTRELTPYGEASLAEKDAQDDLNKKKEVQLLLEHRINGEFGIRAGQVSDEEKAVREVNERYKQLFNDAREMNRDNPNAANERIEQLKAEQSREIAEIHKNYAEKRKVETDETKTTSDILSQAQFDYLEERQEKLTKKEKEMVTKGYEALSAEDAKALKARYDKLMKADANAHKKAYDEKIKQIEENQRREENALKQSLRNNEITQAEYNARMNLLVMKGLQQRIELAKKYGQDETKYFSQLLDEEIKLVGDSSEELKDKTSSVKMPESEAQKNNKKFWEEIYKKRDEIVEGLQNNSLKNEYENELQWIEKLHDKKLLLEEDYQQALLQTKLKYAQAAAEKVNQYAEMASNFVTALKEAETAKLEAEYQAQLTAAGDNAEQREQIEADYEQKKLDLQKKYADVEMAINIAKTIANGAAAAIRAYLDGGAYAGPILAALVAAATAAEVVTIEAQRNAIKNTSVSSSGSSASLQSGERKLLGGNGGYAEGGYTEDHTTLTTVGERGTEYVIPHWMVRKHPVMIANLERYRKAGSLGRSGSVRHGFADGGFTSGTPAAVAAHSEADIEAAVERAIARSMANGTIRAFIVRSDLTALDNQTARFKSQTTR